MSKKIVCPECDKTLLNGAKHCRCGWHQSSTLAAFVDHDCQFVVDGRRCPLTGNMSHSRGVNAIWYCSYHYDTRNDPLQSKAVLNYIEENYQEIMSGKISKYVRFHVEHNLLKNS